jgi:hypothetical protein
MQFLTTWFVVMVLDLDGASCPAVTRHAKVSSHSSSVCVSRQVPNLPISILF